MNTFRLLLNYVIALSGFMIAMSMASIVSIPESFHATWADVIWWAIMLVLSTVASTTNE